MRSNWHRALLVSFVLIMSSLAGCIGTDDEDELEEGQYGTVMVSTYHVGEIVKAIAGDTVNIQMMSQDNIPVHDYEPSLEDIVRLGDADLFLYHGLGLEPWAESTLEGLGSDAPANAEVHTMPTGEITLDYETMLVDKLCDSLSSPSATVIHMLAEHAEDAEELHGEDGVHNLGFPEDGHDDHDDHGDEDHGDDDHGDEDHGDDDHDDHEDHGDDDHDDHDDHGDHDEHDHGDHEMLMPEDSLEASSDCPTGTVISVYHFEAGEYMLEFEGEDVETFMMAIAAMGGAHHHHHDHGDHDDHDDHGDDDHGDDDHGDDDHDDHDDHGDHGDDDHGEHDEDMHAEDVMAMFDSNSDGYLSLEEFMEGMESMEDEDDHDHDHGNETHDDGNETHDDDHDFEHEFEEAFFGHYFNEADADGDGLLDMAELETLAETMNNMEGDVEMDLMIEIYMTIFDEDENGVLSVEEFTEMMEMMMLMDEDDHDDHDDHDHGEHDEDEMVCYDMSTHTVNNSYTNQTDCEAAGLMWTAANSGPGSDDDHDDDMNMTAMAEMMFAMFDTNEDGSLDESEVHTMMEGMMGEEHEEGVAFIGLHIEEEGEYGIALPAGVELHVLTAGGHEGHDHGSHDDHADDEEGHDDHGDEDDHDDHADEDDHDDHAEEELAYDPHSWLDPVAMIAQTDVVLAKLIEVFPDGEDVFTENANAFKAELVALDEKYEALTSNCADATVAANHNAYSYLAYRYDIEFVTVHGLDPEGEPSPENVAEVIEHIEEEGITVLFVEEYTDQSAVQSIVDESGVVIKTLYTMEMAPMDPSDDYLSLMNKNYDSLEEGMSCSA